MLRGRAPEVTVVFPTRDRWDLLRRTLPTVLNQEAVYLEVVLVDDGSRDDGAGSVLVADERVRVIRHLTAQGVARARNTGIAAARGIWTAFLDDDDPWAPRKLRSQLDAANSDGGEFAYSGVLVLDEALRPIDVWSPPPPHELRERLRGLNAFPAGASNVVVRTDAIRRIGGFDERLAHVADWDAWIRLAGAAMGNACEETSVSTGWPAVRERG